MSDKLHRLLPTLYAQMHAEHAFKGDSWTQVYARFLASFGTASTVGRRILDYGCGPEGGLAATLGAMVVSHDPYVPRYAADPWKSGFTDFFSCDVFEHMPESDLATLCLRLRKHTPCQSIFVALSTRPAQKSLPNGINAHITIRSVEWWHGFFAAALSGPYTFVAVEADELRGECILNLRRDAEYV